MDSPRPGRLGLVRGELRRKTVVHLAAILLLVVVATVLFSLVDGQSLAQSLYFIVMVMTLIGANNPNTFGGELIGIVVAVVSVGIILSFLTQILGPAALSAYWEGYRARKASRMRNHVVVCGFSDTVRALLNSLPKDQTLVVVKDKPTLDALTERGHAAIQGDYETLDVLRRAGVPESRAVIAASPQDSENAFVCLTSKQLARGVPVFATVSSQENTEKLKEVKADHIISPGDLSAAAILADLRTL